MEPSADQLAQISLSVAEENAEAHPAAMQLYLGQD